MKMNGAPNRPEQGIAFRKMGAVSEPVNDMMKKEITFGRIDEHSPGSRDLKGRVRKPKDVYYEACDNLTKVFRLIKNKQAFSVEPMMPYASDFVKHVREEADLWLQLLYMTEEGSDVISHIAIHSLDVAIVAIRIGMGLRQKSDCLIDLAMQAFFHDVGMLKVPEEIIQKKEKLTSDEILQIRKHPEHGYGLLRGLGEQNSDMADIIYQEHERYDGSGYPTGCRSGDIRENSFIIGIADMYAALVHPRPNRARYLPFDAICKIISSSKGQFPRSVAKALVNEFSAFPVGINVRLNSKETGRVIGNSKLSPLRPVVKILYDADGRRLHDERVVDLMKDHCLSITSAYYDETDEGPLPVDNNPCRLSDYDETA